MQRSIRAVQSLAYSRLHASFTHVALYVGDGYVVDATPSLGVAARRIDHILDEAFIRARRLIGVTKATQEAIAFEAIRWAKSGMPYAKVAAAAAAFASVGRPPAHRGWATMLARMVEKERTSLGRTGSYSCAFCGNLVDDIFAAVANRPLADDISCFAALPAAFSADARILENVFLRR